MTNRFKGYMTIDEIVAHLSTHINKVEWFIESVFYTDEDDNPTPELNLHRLQSYLEEILYEKYDTRCIFQNNKLFVELHGEHIEDVIDLVESYNYIRNYSYWG